MIKRILIYGFPFFLIALEIVFRKALGINSQIFIGPSLAGVGIGFLLSLTTPRKRDIPLSPETLDKIKELGMVMIPKAEQTLIDIVWIFIFLLTASWFLCLYLSSVSPQLIFLTMPVYQIIGYANYFVGVIFSEIKEAI